MRILHVVPTYIPAYRYGGTITSIHGLCKALVNLGHEVTVFTTNVDGRSDSKVPLLVPVKMDGVTLKYFPSRIFRRLYYSSPMKDALNNECANFDIIHLHSIFLWPTSMAARIAQRMNIPYVVSPRGMLIKEMIRRKNQALKLLWITFIEKKTLENASAIHATSSIEEEEIKAFKFKLPPIHIVPNGIHIFDRDRPANNSSPDIKSYVPGLADQDQFVLFLGRLHWKKGLDRLIAAMAFVPKIKLVITGNDEDNYTPALRRMAREHGVLDRIIFTGALYGEKKNTLLRRAMILAAPSYSENFGNVVLEAMAEGCPVVVTPEVGLSHMIKETGSGVVVNGDPRSLGLCIKDLISNPETLKRMGEIARRMARERFTWHVVSEQMERVYQRVSSSFS